MPSFQKFLLIFGTSELIMSAAHWVMNNQPLAIIHGALATMSGLGAAAIRAKLHRDREEIPAARVVSDGRRIVSEKK
jgi:hypothetical protein